MVLSTLTACNSTAVPSVFTSLEIYTRGRSPRSLFDPVTVNFTHARDLLT